jgi:hypothetical protein
MGWEFKETKFGGAYSMTSQPRKEQGMGIAAGVAKLKAAPEKYEAIMFQNNIGDDVQYTLFKRGMGVSAKPTGGPFTLIQPCYTAFGAASFTDTVSDTSAYANYDGRRYELKRIGRGEGICDLPGLKLFGDIDPADLVQGGVGNCWVILQTGLAPAASAPASAPGLRRATTAQCAACPPAATAHYHT